MPILTPQIPPLVFVRDVDGSSVIDVVCTTDANAGGVVSTTLGVQTVSKIGEGSIP